jgi:hypothetical protein
LSKPETIDPRLAARAEVHKAGTDDLRERQFLGGLQAAPHDNLGNASQRESGRAIGHFRSLVPPSPLN